MSALLRCALCERRKPSDLIDHVDTFAGMSGIPVCHVCVMGHGEAMDEVAGDVAVARFLQGLDLAPALPTDADFFLFDGAELGPAFVGAA